MGKGRFRKPDSQREAITPRCFVCREFVLYERDRAGGHFIFRGTDRYVCTPCRGRYYEPALQAQIFAGRLRWLERHEVPTFRDTGARGDHAVIAMICMILLHVRERQVLRQKEVNNFMSATEQARRMAKLPDRIAIIVGKTHEVCGDDFKLSDDEALTRIRDLLEAIDPTIIDRNKNKRLP